MKHLINNILLASFFLSMIACDSVRKLSIEVQKPAAITLPLSVQNVLVLNNAVSQPNTYGIWQNFNGAEIKDSCKIDLDSAVWRTANTMAAALKISKFFNSVAMFREPIRADKEWLMFYPIPEPIQENFYKAADCDALFTIDRLILALKENVKNNKDYTDPIPGYYTDITLEAMLTCSFYMSDSKKPFKTISITDSLFFINLVENELPFIYTDIPEIMIAEIGYNIGKKMAAKFLPTWEAADRLVYMNSYSRMKDANSFSLTGNWDKAKALWITEFESHKKPISKARVASNIALACEMMDDIDTALVWATKAKDFFESGNKNEHHTEEVEFIDKYITELQTRIENNNLIDLQMGVKFEP